MDTAPKSFESVEAGKSEPFLVNIQLPATLPIYTAS